MQRESEAASGASAHLSAGKEDIQDAQTSRSEDNGPPIDNSNRQASDDFIPQSLQIDNDDDEPLAISPYEALTSDWTSELMNSHHDHMDHRHGFNVQILQNSANPLGFLSIVISYYGNITWAPFGISAMDLLGITSVGVGEIFYLTS